MVSKSVARKQSSKFSVFSRFSRVRLQPFTPKQLYTNKHTHTHIQIIKTHKPIISVHLKYIIIIIIVIIKNKSEVQLGAKFPSISEGGQVLWNHGQDYLSSTHLVSCDRKIRSFRGKPSDGDAHFPPCNEGVAFREICRWPWFSGF